MISALAIYGTLIAPLPNVVIILTDDIGYGDLSSYGATKIATPNIDRIAQQGIRFTDAHSTSAMCTPTRFSMITGQYAWRNKTGGAGVLPGDAPLAIPKSTRTMPQMFRKAGYQTGVVGKWHLGLGDPAPDFNRVLEPGVKQVGFDYSFIYPGTGDRVPCVYVENGRVVNLDPNDPIKVSYKEKIGTEPTGFDMAGKMKLEPTKGHRDTVVNGLSRIGWMTGGKSARWIDEDMSDTLARKAVQFVETNQRSPFFLYYAPHSIHVPQLPHKRFIGKSKIGLRGDAILELDDAVGQLLRALDRKNLARNTIVIFSSDNGGQVEDGYVSPKGDEARDDLHGHRVNGVLRGEKTMLYEGGHRVPFMIRWPEKIKAGQESQSLLGLIDLYHSFSSLIGQKLESADAPDSFDLSRALLDPRAKGRQHLVLHTNGTGGVAMREGDWKLIPRLNGKHELFNLRLDLSEKTNRAAEEKAKVDTLSLLLERIKSTAASRDFGIK